jgi:MFS family permease
LPAIGCLILTGAPDFTWAVVAALLIGFAAGAELDLMAFFAARYFGLAHYAKIYAILYAILAVAGGLAPMLFARVFDVTASYDISFLIATGLFLFGAVILLACQPASKTDHLPASNFDQGSEPAGDGDERIRLWDLPFDLWRSAVCRVSGRAQLRFLNR